MSIALLSVFAAMSLTVLYRASHQGFDHLIYVAKPLTMVAIGAIAWLIWPPVSADYQKWILIGLGLSLVGDVFLMLPKDRFLPGLGSFLLAHLAYVVALVGRIGDPDPMAFLPFALAMVFVARLLWPKLGSLRIPVLLYGLVLGVMAGLALAVAVETGGLSAWMAAVGGTLFVISDTTLAFDRFLRRFDPHGHVILSTYFLAQWMLAMSVWA